MTDATTRFYASLPALEAALRRAVGDADTGLDHCIRYVMGWQDEHRQPTAVGGKRLRPLLALFAGRAFGGADDDAMPAAMSVELVHNFSLIHDDIQDRDVERHGRPSLWTLVGEAQAINAGDYLYTRAIRVLTSATAAPVRRLAALDILERAVERMVQGQWQDLSFEERDEVEGPEYPELVGRKTGPLVAAPLEMGALLAGAEPARATLLGRWGEEMGLAFQMQDDYLGTWGDTRQTGKAVGADIARRKKTYPIILGLRDREARYEIAEVTAPGREITPDDVARVVSALDGIGAGEQTREEAAQHARVAESILNEIGFSPALRSEFQEIGELLVNRKF